MIGATIGVLGVTGVNISKRSNDSREAVIRLTMAVESIAGKLEELHQDMKEEGRDIQTKLTDIQSNLKNHEHRLTVMEAQTRHKSAG